MSFSNMQTAMVVILTAVAVAFSSCRKKTPEDASIAAKVGTATLTDRDIALALPSGLTPEDSTKFVEQYVDTWIANKLITEIAVKNIHNTENIDKLTDEYRRELIMMEYRKTKVMQDTALAIKETDIRTFYDSHNAEFHLKEPMIKGIFITIPASSPQLTNVKKWYSSSRPADIERLEKVGLTEAISYHYFRDRWTAPERIISRLPQKIEISGLKNGVKLEQTDNGMVYLLSVSDLLPAGSIMPYETAKPLIIETLENARRLELDRRLRNQLYQEALNDGKAYKR